MKQFRHIALTLENNSVCAVEVEFWKNTKILTFGDYKSQINFDDLNNLPSKRNIILAEFKNFLTSIKSSAENISFALNSHSIYINSIPIDNNLSEPEIKSVIEWDFKKTYSTFSSSDFIINSHQLPMQIKSSYKNYLLVGLNKKLIGLLEDISKSLNKKLNIIEVDHFGAENFLNSTNAKIKQQKIALIGADENSFDVSILLNGESQKFSIFSIEDSKSYDRIAKYLLDAQVVQIFIYGRFVDGIISSSLSKLISIPITILNPIKNLPVSKLKKDINTDDTLLSRYTSCAGLALRLE